MCYCDSCLNNMRNMGGLQGCAPIIRILLREMTQLDLVSRFSWLFLVIWKIFTQVFEFVHFFRRCSDTVDDDGIIKIKIVEQKLGPLYKDDLSNDVSACVCVCVCVSAPNVDSNWKFPSFGIGRLHTLLTMENSIINNTFCHLWTNHYKQALSYDMARWGIWLISPVAYKSKVIACKVKQKNSRLRKWRYQQWQRKVMVRFSKATHILFIMHLNLKPISTYTFGLETRAQRFDYFLRKFFFDL